MARPSHFDWDTALERVRAGEYLTAFAGTGDMPTRGRWNFRLKHDAEFRFRAIEARNASPLAVRGQSRLSACSDPVPSSDAFLFVREQGPHPRTGRVIKPAFYIKDGRKKFSTGCGLDERERAEQALADHIAGRFKPVVRGGFSSMARLPTWAPVASEAGFAEALRRVGEGEPFYLMAGQAGLPTAAQWDLRRRRDPVFADQVKAAMGRRSGRNRLPANTWDQIVAELDARPTTLRELGSRPGFPHVRTIGKKMANDPAFKARVLSGLQRCPLSVHGGGRRFSPEVWDGVVEALRTRPVSLHNFALPGLPRRSAILRRRKADPDFDARVRAAISVYRPLAVEGTLLRRALSQNEIYAAADAVVPKHLPSFIRDDIRSEMMADHLDGELDVDDFSRAVKAYVTDYYRQHNTWRDRSLDAPLWHDGPRTFGERIPA